LNRNLPQRRSGDVKANNDIVAGQRPVWSDVVSQLQTIALALSAIDVFAMTNHVECVALLVKTGSDLR
jgi:hypothetical protein